MTLSDLKTGEKGIIVKVKGRGAFRKRIIEMGFVKGKEVEVIKNAPLKDPIEYKIMGYNLSLRRSEARLIDVINYEDLAYSLGDEQNLSNLNENCQSTIDMGARRKRHNRSHFAGKLQKRRGFWGSKGKHRIKANKRAEGLTACHEGDEVENSVSQQHKVINVALVGNPNSGKTSLFNIASGSRERVGNYCGVTVEAKEGVFYQNDYRFDIIDLPGTYSITAYTPEELFVRNYIFDNTPDVVINVLDSTNLERNLYLTSQLIDMDIKVVVALNMFDEFEKTKDEFDYDMLGKMIGIPYVPTVSPDGKGVKELFEKVIDVYEDREESARHIHINYGHDIENSIKSIQDEINIKENFFLTDRISSRFLAIKLLEKDEEVEEKILESCNNCENILSIARDEINSLEKHLNDDSETLITDAKYAFIAGALKETYKSAEKPGKSLSERIDYIITHKYFGFPIFLFFLWTVFQLTFSLGEYPMNWIEAGIGFLSNLISNIMPPGLLKDLIIDGVIAGAGGVIVFLPNIMILFFLISLMEDTGYMARASFIMDKLMHKIGLHGKSFIPLIMGFGCNVPAIMATRTLESKNDRLLTMLIIPFMSCSARLPVYVLFISAFYPDSPGTMLFMIYIIGIIIAIIVAKILKRTMFSANDIPFVMEFPTYKNPHFKTTMVHMWDKAVQYLKKIGGIILLASIIIWALGKFPTNSGVEKKYDSEIYSVNNTYENSIKLEKEKEKIVLLEEKRDKEVRALQVEKNAELLEYSYIARIGKFIEPVISPLGFDWKTGVSIITGLAAKEIVVSTMGVLYHVDADVTENNPNLITNLREQTFVSGKRKGEKVFNDISVLGFILFVLIYFPCAASVAAIKRESGHWKWALFAAFYTTAIAWLVAFTVYQLGNFLIK